MPTRLRWIVASVSLIFAVALGFLMYLLISMRAQPPLPPLLRHVSAAAGYVGGCPAGTPAEARRQHPLALSPELNQRLIREFPHGSSGKRIEEVLTRQRFHMLPPCQNDRSIRAALFHQIGGGFFGPYPIRATVYWKVNRGNKIVWTKGFVEYTGP